MVDQQPITKESLNTNITDTQWVLRHFKGRCTDYNLKPGSGQYGPYTDVVFDFDQVEIFPGGSTIPYQLTTGQIGVRHNDKSSTVPWAHFAKSLSDIMGQGVLVNVIVGKVLEIDWQKRSVRRPVTNPETGQRTDEWVDALAECYIVNSIDGATPTGGAAPAAVAAPALSGDDLLVSLADGKDAAAFNQAAITNEVVKADNPLFQRVMQTGDACLSALVASGKLTKDEAGLYHKV